MSFVAVGTYLVLTAAAAGLNYFNTSQEENKANQIEANEINQQTALQKKAAQDTTNLLNKDQATTSDQPQVSNLKQSYLQALQANNANANAAQTQVGNVSSAYNKASNDAALGVSDYSNKQATDLAEMGAPGLQRQGWNANLANYGGQIGAINLASQGDQGVAQVQLNSVHANPWLTALASGLNSYATSGAGMSGLTGLDGSMATGVQSAPGGYLVNLPKY